MPYLTPERKQELEHVANAIGNLPKDISAGDINYLICCIIVEFLKRKGLSYQSLNDIEGALSCASKEIYRRYAAGYEDLKIEDNGDVFPYPTVIESAFDYIHQNG